MATPESSNRFADYIRANRAFFAFISVIVLSVFGYFWWRSGFTFDFSRFFAAEPPALVINGGGGPYAHGDQLSVSWSATNADYCNSVNGWIDTGGANEGTAESGGIDACAASQGSVGVECFYGSDRGYAQRNFSIDSSTCPSAKHLACRNFSCQKVDGGGGAEDGCTFLGESCGGGGPVCGDGTCEGNENQSNCSLDCGSGPVCGNGQCESGENNSNCSLDCAPTSSNPCAGVADVWVENGVTVCTRSLGGWNPDRCTMAGPGTTLNMELGIVNNSGGTIARRTALFYCPFQTCGAIDQNSGTGCTTAGTSGIFSGPSSIANGDSGIVTYRFSPGADCGTWQLDDTWDAPVFVIGKVINTGVSCAPPPSHLECVSNTCTRVDGGGASTCTGEGSSCGTTPTHLECVSNACTRVDGGGASTCAGEGSSCGTTPTHLECVSSACTRVTGPGSDLCTPEGSACGVTPTHLECVSNACTRVNGAGTDACSPQGSACGVTTPPLSCVGTVTQAAVGQAVPFSATGGTGSYSWYAPGGVPPTGGGASFQSTYSAAGFKTVTVASGGQQATCTVTILAPQTSTPPTELICTPASQNVVSGQPATVSATGGSPGYWWSAPEGNPPLQQDVSSASFTTIFTNTTQPSRVFPITVIDTFDRTAVCNVTVACAPPSCAAPPEGCTYQGGTACSCGTLVCPSGAPLVCAPLNQEVSVGQTASFEAAGGGVTTFSWSAPSGNPPSGSGSSTRFATRYSNSGNYQVTVSGGGQSSVCNVRVRSTSPPSTTITPPPTSPAITIAKTVRNVTANGPDTESANADPGHTVEFTIRVSSVGSGTARNVTVRDALPAGLNYQGGTTTVDGAVAVDGITTSGISLGDMPSGRTVVIRFRAVTADASFFTNGTTTLVNTAFARGSNTNEVSDNAQVVVTRGQGLAMSLSKLGRNVTRGESGEHSPVNSSPGQTIEFFIHVRNTSAAPLTNVVVRDIVPERIAFIPGTVRLNGQSAADTLVTSGLPIGSLAVGAEAVITFSGRVAADIEFAPGSVTLTNTAQATADGVPMLQAQLPVIVTKGTIVTVPTGPGESTLLALIISALITLLYVGYTSTESFRRREAAGLAGHAHDDKGSFDFKRS